MFCCCSADQAGVPAIELPNESEGVASGAGGVKIESLPVMVDLDGGFMATLTRDRGNDAWGMIVDIHSGRTYITALMPGGKAEAYNAGTAEDRRICANDCIASVNGVSEASAISRTIAKELAITMVIKRPKTRDVTVPKGGRPMGMVINHTADGNVLFIKSIAEDSIVKSAGIDLKVGDRIFRVNGREGKAPELLDEIKTSDEPILLVSRDA
mmetsp:Transcript_35026/g.69559  ORF Transcript_35026/g.69559 Transcript_35026/m.69559 type:complete len:212 (-) Transcript_35026:113-748(-)